MGHPTRITSFLLLVGPSALKYREEVTQALRVLSTFGLTVGSSQVAWNPGFAITGISLASAIPASSGLPVLAGGMVVASQNSKN